MTRTTLTLAAFALFMALTWVGAIVACLLATSPLAVGFWMAVGLVNGIVAFDVATDAIESHVRGW